MSQTDEWIDVQTFADLESAKEILSLFQENRLNYMIVEDKRREVASIDMEFSNRGIAAFHLQVLPQDIERAQRIIALASGQAIAEVDEDDYISRFSNDELLEILQKADEWNPSDVQLAFKFLNQRGHTVLPEDFEKMRQQRMQELEKPIDASSSFLILGYAFAILGGFIGLMIGFQITTYSKRLPDGRKVHHYTLKTRKKGQWILGLSMLVSLAMVIAYFWWMS